MGSTSLKTYPTQVGSRFTLLYRSQYSELCQTMCVFGLHHNSQAIGDPPTCGRRKQVTTASPHQLAAICIGTRVLPDGVYATSFLSTTINSSDGSSIPATKWARSRPLCLRHRHTGFKSRQGYLWYSSSSSCFWVRWCSLNYVKGMHPHTPQRASDSRSSRTQWPTTRTTSTSGYPALTCVKPLSGV